MLNLLPAGQGVATPAEGLSLACLAGLPPIERPLSVPGIEAAPTSNMDIELDNADGALTRLWAGRPPVRRAARVRAAGGVLFAGVVTGVQLGTRVRLSLEAGMDRPCRTTCRCAPARCGAAGASCACCPGAGAR
ncbi:hypothetical protein MASR1M50_08790 [Burkholderiales bacterium]